MGINYAELYERIIKNKNITPKRKAALIRILKYYTSFTSLQDAKEKEDEIYTVSNNKISDKERINLELYNIEDLYKKKEYIDKKMDEYINLKKKYSFLTDESNYDDYQKIKEELTEFQMDNDISPKFYSAYERILQKYTEEEERKKTM